MSEDRPPFVIQRAHGVAPNVDGETAEQQYQMNQPRRQSRSASATVQVSAPAVDVKASLAPHQLVLADLITKRNQIDAAIAAIEALYK